MAKLLAYRGTELIQELDLVDGETYFVGRKEGNDILLEKLPGISRQHFKVQQGPEGIWDVEVLSEMKHLEMAGKEIQQFSLEEGTSFRLPPYRFVYETSEGSQITSDSSSFEFNKLDESANKPADPPEPVAPKAPEPVEDDFGQEPRPLTGTFVGNEEKTQVKQFKGIPYIKILAQYGKKAEFFRLEGHLWIAGNDAGAALYLNDAEAAPSHFEISRSDKGFFVTDLGTPSGTSINGQKLPPHTKTALMSGDIITVGSQSLQFELRDQSFKEKVKNVPLHMYQNPLIFYDQEVGMVNTQPEEFGVGHAEEIEDKTSERNSRRKTMMMIAASVVVLLAVLSTLTKQTENTQSNIEEPVDPFSKLDPKQKKMVLETYKLAKNLYLNANFELALAQLQKLHSIIDTYKDSRQMEEYCINSRELKQQKALLEQQKKQEEENRLLVQQYLDQCERQYANSIDIDGARACLSTAIQMDPNNPKINQILSVITARIEERALKGKIEKEMQEKARRGKNLYLKAKDFHNRKDFIKAMEAYENHIHSGLPDPENLIPQSKRNLASIERFINQKKKSLMWVAKQSFGSGDLKKAVLTARDAQKVDPFDYKISYFLNQAEKELNNKMKNIYMDSVIEERFGDLESSRLKWVKIINSDVNDGEYYKKAKRKLQQYGF